MFLRTIFKCLFILQGEIERKDFTSLDYKTMTKQIYFTNSVLFPFITIPRFLLLLRCLEVMEYDLYGAKRGNRCSGTSAEPKPPQSGWQSPT